MKHINQGDKKAFRKIFDQYFKALCAFGYRYVPDSLMVEDFVQEAYISLWEARENFDNINAIKAFLYTSVKNKCLNHIKHLSVVQKHEKDLIVELESDDSFANHVLEEEIYRKLHYEIRMLPESAQNIMLLALNGLKNPEIAEELGISVNTVKTQKKIAYSKLKRNLGPVEMAIILGILMS